MIDSDETIILVDDEDREIGLAPKIEAHRAGPAPSRDLRLRARQARPDAAAAARDAANIIPAGLWTNACCTHPRAGESVADAARRRLREELGVDCELKFVLRTHYRADVGNGLIEDEVVHLFLGAYDGAGDAGPGRGRAATTGCRARSCAPASPRGRKPTPTGSATTCAHYADEMFCGLAA